MGRPGNCFFISYCRPLSTNTSRSASAAPKLKTLGLVEFSRPPLLAILLALAILGARAEETPDPSVVAVSGGLVRGQPLRDGGGAVFRGVPFARPPVGEYRWREPAPVVPWAGIREAVKSGPPAAQMSLGWNAAGAAASSEDCLYLDVWTPGAATRAPRPVMVWIHGGGNVAGAGGFDALYDGEALISHGIVLVVIEYRLGIFAFLAHPELTAESVHHSSGNYGILDQIAALKWVRENIARFGGDPHNVTVFGQSAGAIDVLALMATPLSKGLFHKAIAESGPLNRAMSQSLPEAEAVGGAVAGDAASDLKTLRSMSVAGLLKIQTKVHGLRPFTADGWVFPEGPFDVWRAGREHAVPLVVGSNGVEFAFGGSTDELKASIADFAGKRAPEALALYGLSGAGAPVADPLYGTAADQWGSDQFRCYPIIVGEWHASRGWPTWQYEFDRAIPPHPRVEHSGELAYVFGNLHKTGNMPGDYDDADHSLSARIQEYWTNVAKTGNPDGPGFPEWPRFDGAGRLYACFTTDARIEVRANQRRPFVDLFRAVLEEKPLAP